MTYLTSGPHRWYVKDEGAGSPLVFLHGFPLDHQMWSAQIRHFRPHHRVIAPDLRGFGRSFGNDDLVTMEDFADDVAALLGLLEITEPITLCGLSMGGYIALAMVRKYPERIGRLILCDTRSVADAPEAAAKRLELADKVLKDGPRIVAEVMLPRLFGPRTNEDQPNVVDAVRNTMLATSSRAIAAASRGMAARPDMTPFLASLTIPALVIVGEHDQISPPDEMRQMATKVPGAAFVELPGVGHMTPMEAPDAFNAAVGHWLNP